MSVTLNKAIEVVKYAHENGDEKTCEVFAIKTESLERYRRRIALELGSDVVLKSKVLSQIAEQYSDAELQAISKGGRLIPGMARVPIVNFEGERVRFGAITDTHFGSIFTNPDWVLKAFEFFRKEGCEFITHSGDVLEGMSNRPGHVYELSSVGCSAQMKVAIDVLSQWQSDMYLIDGNHDAWYINNAGVYVVKEIAEKLPRAKFIGHHEGDISLRGKATIKLWHGEDGNSYAISYRLQKINEAFTGGEKPNILLAGHTHKQGYFFDRHIHTVSVGCIQRQSTWMRGKRIAAHTGFWVIDVWVNDSGVSRFRPEWVPFYA